jgi:hypothetical protein
MDDDGPTLGELIMQLRRELSAAQRDDPTNPIRFRVGQIELDTSLEVSRAKQGNVGLVLKVLSMGGQRTSGTTNATRVHIVLTPTDLARSDGELYTAAEDTEADSSVAAEAPAESGSE